MQKDKFYTLTNPEFEAFKSRATDPSLSIYEKIGFPDNIRIGYEQHIFNDIIGKLQFDTNGENQVFLDIGPGCSELPLMIQELCAKSSCDVLLVDSKEMLDLLPDGEGITKFPGAFPGDVPELLSKYSSGVDYINVYSLLQCVFFNACIFKFIDSALSLLKPGGKMLIGDIPNISLRKRFLTSQTGIDFHKNYMNTDEEPVVKGFQHEPAYIDDGVLLGLMQRYRGYGFNTYILPQPPQLPMSNRREDLLICKI
jgi:hypothetical protein